MDFKKSKNTNQYIEGYLSNENKFNGVLFLLREPNSEKQESFWLKDGLCWEKKTEFNKYSKRQHTKYISTFVELLKVVDKNFRIEDAAYANILPYYGTPEKSKEYIKLTNEQKLDRFNRLVDGLKVTTVFTCNDIFDAIKDKAEVTVDGVLYGNPAKPKRKMKLDNGITVYEIYHPSYRGKYPKIN